MDDDAPERLDYLAATRARLWPEPDPAAASAAEPTGGRSRRVAMTVLPSRHAARVLAPVRPRRAAASAVLRYSAQHDPRGRLKGLGLAAGIQLGLVGGRDRPAVGVGGSDVPSIGDHLEAVLGQPVLTSLALTHARANRKPVLQVFDRAGHTIAFAKIGATGLTHRLVEAEAAALRAVGARGLTYVRVPEVLDYRHWNDLAVLVLSPMPAAALRGPSADLLHRAMVEVALTDDGGAGFAGYLGALRARVHQASATTGEPAHLDRWTALLEAQVRSGEHAGLTFGSWHGDWARWNFVARRGRLAVWDWERYARPVPIGYDRLHHFLQGQVGTRRDRFATGAPLMIERAPELLARWPISARAARTTALLYVLDISLRYLADEQRTTGGGGAVETWAFPTLEAAFGGAHR